MQKVRWFVVKEKLHYFLLKSIKLFKIRRKKMNDK